MICLQFMNSSHLNNQSNDNNSKKMEKEKKIIKNGYTNENEYSMLLMLKLLLMKINEKANK